jgi:class 3 adenylate cyclase
MSSINTTADRPHGFDADEPSAPVTPRHRCLISVDIEGSTTRTNVARGRLRRVMYQLLEEALQAAGIENHYRDELVDRGDGILALIHPVDQVPKTVLLNTVMPRMGMLLSGHNALHPDQAFRMRAAVHAGEVHFDEHSCFGEAIDLTCRLLDAPELKRWLAGLSSALALVVSDDIYDSVVRHGYDGIDRRDFHPLVRVDMAGRSQRGWVTVPEAIMIPHQDASTVTELSSRRASGRHSR